MELSRLALIAYVTLLIGYCAYRSIGLRTADYLYNSRTTTTTSTFPSVVAGNIGAGTMYGLYAFGAKQPILGFSIALSYMVGLMLAGFLARKIRRASAGIEEISLVGFIAQRHGISDRKRWIVWISIGVVFLLLLSVELTAVGDVVAHVFNVGQLESLLIAVAAVASYLVIGGYRSTTVSAQIQAPLVVGTLLIIGVGAFESLMSHPIRAALATRLLDQDDLVRPIGAFILIAPAVFLSVDNWHRIVTARSERAAKFGFIIGAAVCGVSYAIVVLAAAIGAANTSPTAGLATLMPPPIAWIVPLVVTVAIFSVMDTTIPPLVAGMPGSDRSLWHARAYTICLFGIITIIALVFGNITKGIVAAFSSLAVFLPATISALVRKANSTSPILFGIPISVAAAISMTHFFGEYALATSVLFSAILYCVLTFLDKLREKPSTS